MLNKLQKKILVLLLIVIVGIAPLNASEEHNLTEVELHAFLGIITNFILSDSGDIIPPVQPTLTTQTPATTTDNNTTIEVNGEIGAKVYVDDIEVGTLDENGTIIISIALNHGTNEIYITVKDETGNESEALILNISSNVSPIAVDNNITIFEDISYDLNVTINDSDADGDSLVVTSVTIASHGTTSINIDGTIHYVPDLNFNGLDSFDYNISDGYGGTDTATVNITLSAVNDAPVGIEDNVTTNEDIMLSIAVLDNDSDVDGDTLNFTNISSPNHGNINLNGTNIEYTPNENFNGTDSFTYTPNDGIMDGNFVTINIIVTPVNDIPEADEQNVTVAEDSIDTTITLTGNDVDGDTLSYSVTTMPSQGSVSIIGNEIKYTPTTNFHGTDSFTFVVNDGILDSTEASINIIAISVNDAPVSDAGTDRTVMIGNTINITGSATDIDGTIATYSWLQADNTELATSATFTYSPTFVGTDVLTLMVTDNNGSTHTDTMRVIITEQPPILADQTAQVYTIATTINTLSFTNTGGDITSCSSSPALPSGLVVNPTNSTCEISGIPTAIMSDNNYTITGTNSGGSDTATVSIKISPDLLINEISSAYYTNSDRWFEIYNPTAVDIDISDYTLKARSYDGSTHEIFEFSFPSKTISAGDYLIIKPNYGPAYNTTLPDIENEYIIYLKDNASNKYPYWYSDTKGFLEILKNGNSVDFVTIGYDYTPTTTSAWSGGYIPTFTTDDSEFWKSIARDMNSTDSNTQSDWYVREFPTYAAVNDVTCNDDVDADGIPDCSEVNGSTYAGMDLYAFGARVNQKDIFVEVDYMDSTNEGALTADEGVIPHQDALEKVKDSFLNNGYVVHFDVGDLYAQNGNTIDPSLMDLGGGNEVPYSLAVNLGCTNAGVSAREYKVDNMQVQRKSIFYYMLFGTSQNSNGSSGSSGCAEKPGNDSLMTLGSWGLNTDTVSSTNTLINFQAGTVMHEFGHNLGLSHGGNENKNYKPNYLSVMNYLYQLAGLATIGDNEGDRYYNNKGDGCPNDGLTNPHYGDPRNFKLDYSHGINTNLDEVNGIIEANGLGHVGSVPVDYNCNNDADETLTNFNVNTSWDTTIDTVTDHDDWSVINIIFARTYSGNSGISINSSDNNKISINPLMNDIQPIAEEPPIRIPTDKP